MEILFAAGAFVVGAIVSTIVGQAVQRLFEAPRLDFAIADIDLARTRNRRLYCLPVSSPLRRLLADRPVREVKWSSGRFICEHDVDLSVLELIEVEHQTAEDKDTFRAIGDRLTTNNVGATIIEVATNQQLLSIVKNSLIKWTTKAPSIPADLTNVPVLFPLQRRNYQDKGTSAELVSLDLPGNPRPTIGSEDGDDLVNNRLASLAYALSYGDVPALKCILELATDYCAWEAAQCLALRQEFEKLKAEESYLEIDLVVHNRGKQPSFISTTVEVTVGRTKSPISLAYTPALQEQNADNFEQDIRNWAVRLSQKTPLISKLVQRYESIATYICVGIESTQRLRFVSISPVIPTERDAIQAIRTGNSDCVISLLQYTPRRLRWLPFLNRYSTRITRVHRLSGSNV
jgi:hypothetical protein